MECIEVSAAGHLIEARLTQQERMISAVFVDGTISSLVEAADGLEGSSGSEPRVKLDAQLSNRDLLGQDLIDDVVFESFDVHLEQVDRGITVLGHDGLQIPAVEGYPAQTLPRNRERSLVRVGGQGEFDGSVFRGNPYGEEL